MRWASQGRYFFLGQVQVVHFRDSGAETSRRNTQNQYVECDVTVRSRTGEDVKKHKLKKEALSIIRSEAVTRTEKDLVDFRPVGR